MDTHNPIIIRRAEQRDLKDIHFNDVSLYRTSFDGSKSITLDYVEDFFRTYSKGMCVAEDSKTRVVIGHALCFPFKYSEDNYDFLKNRNISEVFLENSECYYGKTFIVRPEYRKYHVAYSLLKWSYIIHKDKIQQIKSVFGLCESDNRSRKLHYLIGYKPKHVFNNMFRYENDQHVDGILMEVDYKKTVEGFEAGSFKKWFGVTGQEPEYIWNS